MMDQNGEEIKLKTNVILSYDPLYTNVYVQYWVNIYIAANQEEFGQVHCIKYFPKSEPNTFIKKNFILLQFQPAFMAYHFRGSHGTNCL